MKRQRKDDTRSWFFSTATASIFWCIFLLREEPPFNLIITTSNPDFLEWVGLLVFLFLVPAVIYFIMLPSEKIKEYASSRIDGITMFLLFALLISVEGAIIGIIVSFLIGVVFYNLI